MQTARQTKKPGLLEFSAALQKQHATKAAADDRKVRGQVFTPPEVCRFMAARFEHLPEHFRLLDAGAGVGALTAAVCEHVLTLGSPRQVTISLYESDPALLPLLDENMQNCRSVLQAAGHGLEFAIHDGDFILSTQGRGHQRRLFDDREGAETFDAAIMNPPYFKIGARSEHALAMGDTFRSQPNIYTLFMARAVELLRPNGELVAITPRSFCSGPYFRDFRRWFFSRMELCHVHLFECRRSTFDQVLQESVITHTRRQGRSAPSTRITTSRGREIHADPPGLIVPTAKILDDSAGDMVLRIPASDLESELIDLIESWPHRFSELGLRISTGPVVMFRAIPYLLAEDEASDSAPLLGPHNVRAFQTIWPLVKQGKPLAFRLSPESMKHVVPTRNYVLLRRFSAKEERRRLTASWFLQADQSRPYVALENHLNYVYHSNRDLTAEEVYGLTGLFNSALLDGYFRLVSGNTQVNATEIRSLRFPSLDRVALIGRRIERLTDYHSANVERIVLDALGIDGPLGESLMESAS